MAGVGRGDCSCCSRTGTARTATAGTGSPKARNCGNGPAIRDGAGCCTVLVEPSRGCVTSPPGRPGSGVAWPGAADGNTAHGLVDNTTGVVPLAIGASQLVVRRGSAPAASVWTRASPQGPGSPPPTTPGSWTRRNPSLVARGRVPTVVASERPPSTSSGSTPAHTDGGGGGGASRPCAATCCR